MEKETATSFKHVETLTDLCQTEDVSEVQLVSLLEEHIPKYTLRADKLTNFSGYDNEDWVTQTPCFQISDHSRLEEELSLELIEEALKYIVSGRLRMTQMSKAYNDVRALSLLLDEKERDLEVTVSIGQMLIKKVKQSELAAHQMAAKLKENLNEILLLKSEKRFHESILKVYVSDFESDSEEDEPADTLPSRNTRPSIVDISAIKARITRLQRENDRLSVDAARLKMGAKECEEREDRLVEECIGHVIESNFFIQCLQADVEVKTETNVLHEEDIRKCVEEINEFREINYKLSDKLSDSMSELEKYREQKEVAIAEVDEWREKYEECYMLLQETKDEVRNLRKTKTPTSVIQRHYNESVFSPFLPSGSWASELQDYQKKGLVYPLGCSPSSRKTHSRKVMDVARAVQRQASKKNLLDCLPASPFPSDDKEFQSDNDSDSLKSICGSDSRSRSSSLELRDENETTDKCNHICSGNFRDLGLGQPALPGSNDLEEVLCRRLCPSYTCPQFPRFDHGWNGYSHGGNISRDELPVSLTNSENISSVRFIMSDNGISPPSTPRSCSSSSTQVLSCSPSVAVADVPQKLQIIKPIQGSTTLHHWKNLATPNLGGLLDVRPGIQTRGEPLTTYFEDDAYFLSDFEDDSSPTSDYFTGSTIPTPSSNCDIPPGFGVTFSDHRKSISNSFRPNSYSESDVDGLVYGPSCNHKNENDDSEHIPVNDFSCYFTKKQNQEHQTISLSRTLSDNRLIKSIQMDSCSVM